MDQALDHELDALVKVLKHNLLIVGYPIDDSSLFEDDKHKIARENLFKKPFDDYEHLRTALISYVDALGTPYLMPCLCQNPSQTAKARDSHSHVEIRVLSDTHVETIASGGNHLGRRVLNQPVDFDNTNISEEELKARLAAYDAICLAHSFATASLKCVKSDSGTNVLAINLIEALLDSAALSSYKVPLCFRDVDDDLSVDPRETEIPLN